MLKDMQELVTGGIAVLSVATLGRLLYLHWMDKSVDEITLLWIILILSWNLVQGLLTGTRT